MVRYELADGLETEWVADELVVTLKNGDMVVLNESAATAFEVLTRFPDNPVESMASALQDSYGLDEKVARRDALSVLGHLKRSNVLEPVRSTRSCGGRPYQRITRRAFAAGMAAAGLSLFSSPAALGKESASVAEKAYGEGGLGTVSSTAAGRTWTDSLGRNVEVPRNIRRVTPYGPYAQALMESIDCDMIVEASARGLHASLIDDSDELGAELSARADDGVSLCVRALEKGKPDVILDVAVGEGLLATSIDEQADEEGVPVVHMVIAPGGLPAALRSLGVLLGREDRCSELADYIASVEVTLAQVREQVPLKARKRGYFGEGAYGLHTRGSGTLVDDIIRSAGCVNVASDIFDGTGDISVEELEKVSPDLVILDMRDELESGNTRAYREYLWKHGLLSIEAEVSEVPLEPYSWLAASPLIMQTAGALWLAQVSYPGLFKDESPDVAADAWRKLFGYEVSPLTSDHEDERPLGEDDEIWDVAPDFCVRRGERQVGPGGYESPSVRLIAAEALALSTALLASGGGSGGGGGGPSLSVGSESNPLTIAAGSAYTFRAKTACWVQCEIDGASRISVSANGTKFDLTVKTVDTASVSSATYAQQIAFEGRCAHCGKASYVLGILTASQANVSITISQNVDMVYPAPGNWNAWNYDGISAADANILYDYIWLAGPDDAGVLANLVDSRFYEQYEEDIENAVMLGGSVLLGLVGAILSGGTLTVTDILISTSAGILTDLVTQEMQIDVRKELHDQILEKAAMDENGDCQYGIAIYKAKLATLGVRRYRVDRWEGFDTNGDGEYTVDDEPEFGAPAGSRGSWA